MRVRVLLSGLPLLVASACATADGESKSSKPVEGPIVVELFTSQGCSSCPPADRFLGKLAHQPFDGRQLAPLSFHVDYWDDLGWPDPYAKAAWTERQRMYARALGDDRVYTPQLVVGGVVGMVGSNSIAALAAIAKAPVPSLLPATATWSERGLEVKATAPAGADVFVAVWEDGVRNKVPRGENAGEILTHERVVRRLERVASAGTHGTIIVAIDPAWRSIGAIAFAQRADRAIVASAYLRR